jgi:hypothetical protein
MGPVIFGAFTFRLLMGYILLPDVVTFRRDAVRIGCSNVIGHSGRGLLTYLPSSADKGYLVAYEMRGENIDEISIGELDLEKERDLFQ